MLVMGLCVALVGSLAGCGSAKKENDEKKKDETTAVTKKKSGKADLSIAWWGNQTSNTRLQQAMEDFTKENKNISLDGQLVDWGSYWDKLATMASGGTLPDIMGQLGGYLKQYTEADLLLDLQPYIDSGALDVSKIPKDVVDEGKVDGKTVAIGLGLNAWGLAYDAALLKKNGIKIHDNMNIDEFIDICRKVYKKTGFKTYMSATSDAAGIMGMLTRSQGHELWQDGRLGVDKPEDMNVFFDIIETGVKEGWLIDPGVLVERNGNEQSPLVYGETPAERSWCLPTSSNTYLSYVAVQPKGCDLKLTTIPSDNPKKSNYFGIGKFFSISKATKHPDEAVAFVNWYINSTEANKTQLAIQGVPANTDRAKEVLPLVDEATRDSLNFVNDVIMPNSSTPPPTTGAKVEEVKDAFYQIYEKICYGEITADEASKTLYDKAGEIFSEN